jgi:toxin FitB
MPLSRRRTELEAWLNQVVLVQFQQRIVQIDLATMILWGELTGRLEPQGRMLPTMDSLIAAIALQHSFTLVTRNEKDFAGTGLTIFNPWN